MFRRLKPEEPGVAIYAECRWIQPNDTKHNRGAYIAVGCWASTPVTPTQAINILLHIEDIHDDLTIHRDQHTEAFSSDFQLCTYVGPKPVNLYRDQLADLVYLASAGMAPWEEKAGPVNVTSDEIRQDRLAKYCIHKRAIIQSPTQPVHSDNQDWQTQLHNILQELISEAPETNQLTQKLLSLEEERISIMKALIGAINQTSQKSMTRSGRSSRRSDRGAGSTSWRLTLREIGLVAIGIILGVAVALAVIGVVKLLF